jgi:hypothetical protein
MYRRAPGNTLRRMNMKIDKGVFSILFSLVVLQCASAANAQDFVVVAAVGLDFMPGDRINSSLPLDLSGGQHLTLISTAGATLRIDGPYTSIPAETQTEVPDFASRWAQIGVSRAAQLVPLPEPWLFDVSQTGNVCLRDGSAAVFWRSSATAESEFTVTPVDQTWRAQLRWPAGLDRIAADAGLPIRAGANYFMILDGEQSALAVKSVPSTLDNDLMRIAWMVEMGCEPQARALALMLTQ